MPDQTPRLSLPFPLPSDAVIDYPALGRDLAETLDPIVAVLNGFNAFAGGASFAGQVHGGEFWAHPTASGWGYALQPPDVDHGIWGLFWDGSNLAMYWGDASAVNDTVLERSGPGTLHVVNNLHADAEVTGGSLVRGHQGSGYEVKIGGVLGPYAPGIEFGEGPLSALYAQSPTIVAWTGTGWGSHLAEAYTLPARAFRADYARFSDALEARGAGAPPPIDGLLERVLGECESPPDVEKGGAPAFDGPVETVDLGALAAGLLAAVQDLDARLAALEGPSKPANV